MHIVGSYPYQNESGLQWRREKKKTQKSLNKARPYQENQAVIQLYL